MRTLDIGCGNNKVEGAIGADIMRYDDVDVLVDGTCLPFDAGTFDTVVASQVVEHLDPETEVPELLEEVYRVLVPDGEFRFDVPIGRNHKHDPTHESEWTAKRVVYYLPERERDRFGYDPETFPAYFRDYDFEFELQRRDTNVWLESGSSVLLRALSAAVGALNDQWPSDAWATLPLGAGNLHVELRKV